MPLTRPAATLFPFVGGEGRVGGIAGPLATGQSPKTALNSRPDISHSDGNANTAPREGTRPTSTHYRSCRPRALTRRSGV
jgi:hypothetical protein